MIITGTLIHCKRETKKFGKNKSEEKLFITLADANVADEQWKEIKEAFKDAGNKFTPEWVKNFDGFVNVATKFELPVRDWKRNEYSSIEKAIEEDGLAFMGAKAKLSINIKEGAIYPVSIYLTEEGKSFNPFEEFDA